MKKAKLEAAKAAAAGEISCIEVLEGIFFFQILRYKYSNGVASTCISFAFQYTHARSKGLQIYSRNL